MFKPYACKWNQMGSWTKEGDSPVEHKITYSDWKHPSSVRHEESGVNQRGPYHARLNTVVDR